MLSDSKLRTGPHEVRGTRAQLESGAKVRGGSKPGVDVIGSLPPFGGADSRLGGGEYGAEARRRQTRSTGSFSLIPLAGDRPTIAAVQMEAQMQPGRLSRILGIAQGASAWPSGRLARLCLGKHASESFGPRCMGGCAGPRHAAPTLHLPIRQSQSLLHRAMAQRFS